MAVGVDSMEAALQAVFGVGKELSWYQMCTRAALIFVATWLMLRVAGRRTFAQKTAFDLCMMLLLGAILSRAVVGASPMVGTLAAAAVLVSMHRAVSMLSAAWPAFDRIVGGRAIPLVQGGEENRNARKRAMLSNEDLDANARVLMHASGWERQWDVVLERDGQISFIKPKPPHPAPSSRGQEQSPRSSGHVQAEGNHGTG